MALTKSNEKTKQDGLLLYKSLTLTSGAATSESLEIIAPSDFTTQPFGTSGLTIGKMRILRFICSGHFNSGSITTRIEWTATTPAASDFICGAVNYSKSRVDIDFTKLHPDGIDNPMNTGATGGITFYRTVTTGSTGDLFFVQILAKGSSL